MPIEGRDGLMDSHDDDIFVCCSLILYRLLHLFVGETITSRVQDPGIVVGALHARVQPQDLSGQFSVGN